MYVQAQIYDYNSTKLRSQTIFFQTITVLFVLFTSFMGWGST